MMISTLIIIAALTGQVLPPLVVDLDKVGECVEFEKGVVQNGCVVTCRLDLIGDEQNIKLMAIWSKECGGEV